MQWPPGAFGGSTAPQREHFRDSVMSQFHLQPHLIVSLSNLGHQIVIKRIEPKVT
jgi:hypothetical protein